MWELLIPEIWETWTCDWHVSGRQSCEAEPFICGVCVNWEVSVRTELDCRTSSWYLQRIGGLLDIENNASGVRSVLSVLSFP